MAKKSAVLFPVSPLGRTLDGKKKIHSNASKYIKYIDKVEDLSPEEIMYLVKRVGELEDAVNRMKEIFK